MTAGAAVTAVGCTAIATMLMPVIDIGTLFICQEDWGGNDGSGIATEDDDDTYAEAGGYARLGRVFREEEDDNEDGDEQGQRARRRHRDAVEVRDALRGSRDDEHEEDVATRSKFETLCEGEPPLSLSTACPKRRSSGTTVARASGEDPLPGRRRRQRRNGACVSDDNDYERLPYIQRQDDAHNNITFNKKHIICLIFCN
jgi:hypothetical protein